MDKHKRKKLLWSLFLVIIGSVIWLHNWGLIAYSFKFSRDWPVILIAFGIVGIFRYIMVAQKIDKKAEPNPGIKDSLKEILEEIERGDITVEDAIKRIKG